MRKLTNHRLLPYLLAILLLVQSAASMAGWHLEVPAIEHDGHANHCAAIVQHPESHPAWEHDDLDEHHHHYCQTTIGSLALLTTIPSLTLVENSVVVTTFVPQPYHNPTIDLLIRPPIA